MNTLQHTLITLFAMHGNEEQLRQEIPYVLLPDAIRRYLGPRQYSHFEASFDGKDVSWIKFPKDVKNISKETLESVPKHIVDEIKPCVLGEQTQLESFVEHNSDLPLTYYAGVEKHLIQDFIFDSYIRANIDCSRMYEDIFVFKGKEYDGKGIRQVIADIEEYGLYMLAFMNYNYFGITTNQEWFDKNVKQVLDDAYCQDLADGTYKYMQIPAHLNERITNHDWSHFNEGPLSIADYMQMYDFVSEQMAIVDCRRMLREESLGENQNSNREDSSNTENFSGKEEQAGPANS